MSDDTLERPRWAGLEPGELIPDGSGDWVTIPPNTPAAHQMLAVLDQEARRSKAWRQTQKDYNP